ncbi:hypothetical protein, partial [Caballeronia zhejiangensis]|uniref:hypothetical protein n=1 Tax=Caballeronia zhejiangensis TaxID=871203 RepID=UPI0011852EF7
MRVMVLFFLLDCVFVAARGFAGSRFRGGSGFRRIPLSCRFGVSPDPGFVSVRGFAGSRFRVGLLALPLCGAAVTFFAAAKKVTKES